MLHRALLAAVLALAPLSCFAPSYTELRCSPQGTCPDSLVCQSELCIGPGAAPPTPDADTDADASVDALVVPGDEDGDGIADAADNCPRAGNPDQRNHDGDHRGDACDSCPHVNEQAFVDVDGDGIGERCDPRSGPADRLVHFDGFYDDSDAPPAGWMAVAGSPSEWRVREGHLVQISDAESLHVLVRNDGLGEQLVESDVTVVSRASGISGRRTVGVVAGHRGSGGGERMWMCMLHDDAATEGEVVLDLAEHVDNVLLRGNSVYVGSVLDSTTQARFRLQLESSSGGRSQIERCRMSSSASETATPEATDGLSPGGAVGLRTEGVSARFGFVVIYAPATASVSGPPAPARTASPRSAPPSAGTPPSTAHR